MREVRLHVRHINDLMHSIDQIDNFNAINCNSLTYVNEITNGDINGIAIVLFLIIFLLKIYRLTIKR